MAAPSVGLVVPSGSLVSPGGAQGIIGPPQISADAGNLLQFGSDGFPSLPPSNVFYYGADTTNSVAYAITVDSQFTLSPGVLVWVLPSLSCAASPTLNVNGTGAKPIVSSGNIALAANEIPASKMFGVMYDETSWRVITPLTKVYVGTNPGNPTIDCAGYDIVTIYVSTTVSGGTGITLAHLAIGAHVTFVHANSYTAGNAWWLGWTTVTGTAGTTYWVWSNSLTAAGTFTRIDSSTPQTNPTGNTMVLVGSAQPSNQLLML